MAGKRVLITGGGRGIGRAIALNMASRGASVAVLSRTSGEVEAVVAEARAVAPAPDEAVLVALTADVTDEASVSSSIRAAKAALGGGIDVLVNNAGRASAAKGSLWEQRADDFRGLMDTNVLSVFLVSRAVLNEGGMLEAGRGDIINVSSKAGKVGLPGMGPYVASKHAVEGLTATLAKELAAVDSALEHPGPNSLEPPELSNVVVFAPLLSLASRGYRFCRSVAPRRFAHHSQNHGRSPCPS